MIWSLKNVTWVARSLSVKPAQILQTLWYLSSLACSRQKESFEPAVPLALGKVTANHHQVQCVVHTLEVIILDFDLVVLTPDNLVSGIALQIIHHEAVVSY